MSEASDENTSSNGDPLPVAGVQSHGSDKDVARTTTVSRFNTTALQKSALAGMSESELIYDVENFVIAHSLGKYLPAFRKGALIAQVQDSGEPKGRQLGMIEQLPFLERADKTNLEYEMRHSWSSSPALLYFQCALCAACAVVQGMDQTVINGAQVRLD